MTLRETHLHLDRPHLLGTVLVVDDDLGLRRLATRILEGEGLTVVTAADGFEALDRYRETPGIDAVLLDLTMRGMDGAATLRELQRLDPSVRVVLMSGDWDSELVEAARHEPDVRFVAKPFGVDQLAAVVREILTPAHR
jgi:two-component system, cell cycle sensor histidine kinase and response regulator CckA